jgi:hypothetical protein
MVLFSSETLIRGLGGLRRSLFGPAAKRGQALVEYLLMTLMLLALFTGLYRVLQSQLRIYFQKAGQAILTAYY